MNRSSWRSSRTHLGTFLRNHTHLHPYVFYQLGQSEQWTSEVAGVRPVTTCPSFCP